MTRMGRAVDCQWSVYAKPTVQLKIHQSQPNIYTLFWRFDLITRSSPEEAGTQFFRVLMRRSAVASRKRSYANSAWVSETRWANRHRLFTVLNNISAFATVSNLLTIQCACVHSMLRQSPLAQKGLTRGQYRRQAAAAVCWWVWRDAPSIQWRPVKLHRREFICLTARSVESVQRDSGQRCSGWIQR